MRNLHIEGMGLLGSLLAVALEEDGVDFTWSDNNAKVSAWQASTGCVFPTGDPLEAACYRLWINMVANQHTALGDLVARFGELGVWSYLAVNPPHDGKKAGVVALEKLGNLTVSNMHTVQVNVPALVLGTRARFSQQRKDAAPRGSDILVSHGFKRAVRYGWGWSAQVELLLSEELEAACSGARPCLYLRKGYLMYYAYPFPGTDRYIVGTQNVSQKEPKQRATDEPYLKWMDHLHNNIGDHAQVKTLHVGTMMQGWRPYGADTDRLVSRTKSEPRKYFIKPQSGNGLRMFPETYRELRRVMGIK